MARLRIGETESPHLGLHHLNPPSLDSNLTSKRKAWEEHKSDPRDKGMQTQAQVMATMDYNFFALNSLMPSMYPKGSLYSSSMG